MNTNFIKIICIIVLHGFGSNVRSEDYDIAKEIGRRQAMKSTFEEAKRLRGPTGVFGATWLMSSNEVLSQFEPLIKISPEDYRVIDSDKDQIRMRVKMFGRSWLTTFRFVDNALISFVGNSIENPSNEDFMLVQKEIDSMYSSAGVAYSDNEFSLLMKTKVDRFHCLHGMRKYGEVRVEQIILYYGKP